ncbi:hypothetical protein SAMD00019534_037520 [Acytostelium subglobosum LB1]|uniref:hypothetical protein n=1 Tax=Acytostelium subglobosum LB1 TaxID=1410327 RepID=UPI000645045C|nr:hypothetical protein SAMD00019534_037520 [Acytostelium subglobosum LB1]GAM20577.1 hypothetical protein SAMD00019534_037520 [Acytostelium subglobosum LB1]|eukprot:XP_012760098.1 hypothetical protein SAMD00019534_037520 [Acytostelium subglobosum LB1]
MSSVQPQQQQEIITQDGGVKKLLIRAGLESEPQPVDGNEVVIHYNAKRIDGLMFEDTRALNGHAFKFIVGRCTVPGLNLAVRSMRLNELATFTMRSKYCFGSLGYGTVVPPNCSCIYELELISVRTLLDISHDQSSSSSSTSTTTSLLKAITKHSTSDDRPTYESRVVVSYKSKLLDDVANNNISRERYEYVIGEDRTVPLVLDTIVQSMGRDEQCTVYITSGDSKALPSELEVTLHSFKRPPQVNLSSYPVDELLKMAMARKDMAAELFKAKHFELAIRKYQRAIDILVQGMKDRKHDAAMDEQCRAMRIQCTVNQAVCHLQLLQWSQTISKSTDALRQQSGNIKALFLRGKAHLAMHEHVQAKRDFESILQRDPNNTEAKQQLASIGGKTATTTR